jgi:hypothetical protein
MINMVCKRQKFQYGGFDVGFSAALAASEFATKS